jgi:hypothetical protein
MIIGRHIAEIVQFAHEINVRPWQVLRVMEELETQDSEKIMAVLKEQQMREWVLDILARVDELHVAIRNLNIHSNEYMLISNRIHFLKEDLRRFMNIATTDGQ